MLLAVPRFATLLSIFSVNMVRVLALSLAAPALAVSLRGDDEAKKAPRRLAGHAATTYAPIAGYYPASNVDAHAAIDLDVADMDAALDADNWDGPVHQSPFPRAFRARRPRERIRAPWAP